MRKLLLLFIVVFLLFPTSAFAKGANEEFNESFFCQNAVLRWLFRPTCPSLNPPPLPEQTSPTSRTGSLQLRSFEPPATSTPTPAPTRPVQCQFPSSMLCGENCSGNCRGSGSCWECPAFVPTATPTPTSPPQCQFPSELLCGENCSGNCRGSGTCWECPAFVVSPTATPTSTSVQPTQPAGQNFPTPSIGENTTQQVDWVHSERGVCWAAWAASSCSLSSHEGGLSNGSFDITGDGTLDVTCSQGNAAASSTTITNISNQEIPLRCERYTCNSCKSGNGTHAQCDGGIDPTAARVAQEYMLAPGQSATCTPDGIGVGASIPPTTIPTQPVPTQASPPPEPPQLPTPTLPAGNTPPIVTNCRPGTGYCSIENLMRYFPSYTAAYKASVICQAESHSDPLAANRACTTGGSVDYSIGLYQINLLAHCDGAATYTWEPPSCRIISQSKLSACETSYLDPDTNIKKAVALSRNGSDWYPTWGAAGPAYCNIQ